MAGFALWPPQNTSLCKTHCIVWQSGAVVLSTKWRSPWVNRRRSLWVGVWNVLSLRDGDGPGTLMGMLGRWPDGGSWGTGRKWMQRCTVVHAPNVCMYPSGYLVHSCRCSEEVRKSTP